MYALRFKAMPTSITTHYKQPIKAAYARTHTHTRTVRKRKTGTNTATTPWWCRSYHVQYSMCGLQRDPRGQCIGNPTHNRSWETVVQDGLLSKLCSDKRSQWKWIWQWKQQWCQVCLLGSLFPKILNGGRRNDPQTNTNTKSWPTLTVEKTTNKLARTKRQEVPLVQLQENRNATNC